MRRAPIPYIISRAILSTGLGALFVLNGRWAWWAGLGVSTLTFGGFLWYAYSGNFRIDLNTPLTPLRRDARGKIIRDQALAITVVVGMNYALLSLFGLALSLPANLGMWAFPLGVIVYFAASSWLFAWG